MLIDGENQVNFDKYVVLNKILYKIFNNENNSGESGAGRTVAAKYIIIRLLLTIRTDQSETRRLRLQMSLQKSQETRIRHSPPMAPSMNLQRNTSMRSSVISLVFFFKKSIKSIN